MIYVSRTTIKYVEINEQFNFSQMFEQSKQGMVY